MNKEYCEKVRMSAMAISDGEHTLISRKEISEHIETCKECRIVIEQLQITVKLLDGRQRKSYQINAANEIEAALSDKGMSPKSCDYLVYFIMLGLALLILKIINLSQVETIRIILRLLPVAIFIVFFVLIKQNPFSIKENLKMKGDL